MFYDNAGIVVDAAISDPKQMAGKTFGTLQGESEDFAFHGWLSVHGIEDKVKLVGLERQAMVAAFKTKAIAGGMNSEPGMSKMINDGGHLLASIKDISKLGYPALDVLTVDADYASQHPDVVQGYVCAMYGAYKMMTGPDREAVLRKGIRVRRRRACARRQGGRELADLEAGG